MAAHAAKRSVTDPTTSLPSSLLDTSLGHNMTPDRNPQSGIDPLTSRLHNRPSSNDFHSKQAPFAASWEACPQPWKTSPAPRGMETENAERQTPGGRLPQKRSALFTFSRLLGGNLTLSLQNMKPSDLPRPLPPLPRDDFSKTFGSQPVAATDLEVFFQNKERQEARTAEAPLVSAEPSPLSGLWRPRPRNSRTVRQLPQITDAETELMTNSHGLLLSAAPPGSKLLDQHGDFSKANKGEIREIVEATERCKALIANPQTEFHDEVAPLLDRVEEALSGVVQRSIFVLVRNVDLFCSSSAYLADLAKRALELRQQLFELDRGQAALTADILSKHRKRDILLSMEQSLKLISVLKDFTDDGRLHLKERRFAKAYAAIAEASSLAQSLMAFNCVRCLQAKTTILEVDLQQAVEVAFAEQLEAKIFDVPRCCSLPVTPGDGAENSEDTPATYSGPPLSQPEAAEPPPLAIARSGYWDVGTDVESPSFNEVVEVFSHWPDKLHKVFERLNSLHKGYSRRLYKERILEFEPALPRDSTNDDDARDDIRAQRSGTGTNSCRRESSSSTADSAATDDCQGNAVVTSRLSDSRYSPNIPADAVTKEPPANSGQAVELVLISLSDENFQRLICQLDASLIQVITNAQKILQEIDVTGLLPGVYKHYWEGVRSGLQRALAARIATFVQLRWIKKPLPPIAWCNLPVDAAPDSAGPEGVVGQATSSVALLSPVSASLDVIEEISSATTLLTQLPQITETLKHVYQTRVASLLSRLIVRCYYALCEWLEQDTWEPAPTCFSAASDASVLHSSSTEVASSESSPFLVRAVSLNKLLETVGEIQQRLLPYLPFSRSVVTTKVMDLLAHYRMAAFEVVMTSLGAVSLRRAIDAAGADRPVLSFQPEMRSTKPIYTKKGLAGDSPPLQRKLTAKHLAVYSSTLRVLMFRLPHILERCQDFVGGSATPLNRNLPSSRTGDFQSIEPPWSLGEDHSRVQLRIQCDSDQRTLVHALEGDIRLTESKLGSILTDALSVSKWLNINGVASQQGIEGRSAQVEGSSLPWDVPQWLRADTSSHTPTVKIFGQKFISFHRVLSRYLAMPIIESICREAFAQIVAAVEAHIARGPPILTPTSSPDLMRCVQNAPPKAERSKGKPGSDNFPGQVPDPSARSLRFPVDLPNSHATAVQATALTAVTAHEPAADNAAGSASCRSISDHRNNDAGRSIGVTSGSAMIASNQSGSSTAARGSQLFFGAFRGANRAEVAGSGEDVSSEKHGSSAMPASGAHEGNSAVDGVSTQDYCSGPGGGAQLGISLNAFVYDLLVLRYIIPSQDWLACRVVSLGTRNATILELRNVWEGFLTTLLRVAITNADRFPPPARSSGSNKISLTRDSAVGQQPLFVPADTVIDTSAMRSRPPSSVLRRIVQEILPHMELPDALG